ncbi:hypothetical protein C8J98_102196 [Luteibacter sp. OK325]|uniref:DUF6931 family protein n=1 Tax=Luteibacter sp. OK325 TaxID=2135670 RepID=UPI000D365810|nr:hypothetical protein [Luteibacter sp. OK325]PTR34008.1 hypothetical protein C8J98_102196 [Luteibacter sp. OK325]
MPLTTTLAARDMGLDASVAALLHDEMTERAAVRALLDHGDAGAALRVALRLMPRGYVVPWLCQCVRGEAIDDDALDGLLVAEAWLRERGEPRRRGALAFAAGRHYVGIGALVAASAAWSEGFLLDGEGREVAPVAPQLMAVVAAAALLTLASTRPDFDAQCRAFVASAMGLLPPEISE